MNPHRAISDTIHANLETAILAIGRSLGRCYQTVKKRQAMHHQQEELAHLNPRLLADAGMERPVSVSNFNALSVDSPLAMADDISFRLGH